MVRSTANQIDRYLDLIRTFPLRPIRSEKELDHATDIIHSLIDRVNDLEPSERDYLDVLSDLVEKYEHAHHAIEDVSDVEMLRHLIESGDDSQRQIAIGAGISISTLSDILTGRRSMNRSHIEKLSEYFRVEPAVFLPAARIEKRVNNAGTDWFMTSNPELRDWREVKKKRGVHGRSPKIESVAAKRAPSKLGSSDAASGSGRRRARRKPHE